MASTIAIPGRRVSKGETFYTDWVQRGGDCVLVRAQDLVKSGTGSVDLSLETRGEDGTTVTPITATTTAISLSSPGIQSCLYLATTSTTAGNGAQSQVRVKITYTGGSAGDYQIVRIFPLIFFDSAKPY